MDSDNKKLRASRPKVRTGCLTCKIRHIKCDEGKPECGQCRKTKRKCDGYDNIKSQPAAKKHLRRFKKPVDRVVIPTPRIGSDSCLVLRPGTREERQYAELFCNQTSLAISGFFASEFWDHLLPQLSYSEPALRHAIVAVGAAYEQYVHAESLSSSPSASIAVLNTQRNEPFILEQYNKAIRSLNPSLSSSSTGTLNSTLITCTLFVFLEIIRGNFPQALNHIEAGLKILDELKERGVLNTVNRDLLGLFCRFNIQKSLFGRSLMTLEDPSREMQDSNKNSSFTTFLEARASLDSLMTKSLTFIRSVRTRQESSTTTQLQEEQSMLITELNNWSSMFEQLVKRSPRTVKGSDRRGPLILRIHYIISSLWLETCLSADEMVFDNHLSKFEDMIINATAFTSNESADLYKESNDPISGFCGDMGIIPPLHYTALKCRDSILRRKAIALLSSYRRREGMWDATQCARIAEYVVAIEEDNQLSLPVETRVLPDVTHRIYEVFIPEGAMGNSVQFTMLSKPDGVNGDWHSETQSIRW